MTRASTLLFAGAVLAAVSLVSIATAGEGRPPPAGAPIAAASLVAETPDVVPGRPFDVALRLTLPAGWHTYWRNTGDAGSPTAIAWTLPAGFAAGPLSWPTPSRFVSGPVVSYGLAGDVWLLTRITPPADLAPGTTATLTAAADWLVCADICVPEAATLTLRLPVAATARPAEPATGDAFAAARRALPAAYPGSATLAEDGDRLLLDIGMPVAEARTIDAAWFFPERFGVVDNAGAQTLERTAGGVRLILPAAPATTAPSAVAGVLVIERGGRRTGYDIEADFRS